MSDKGRRKLVRAGWMALMTLTALPTWGQFRQEPGHSIGTVTRQGNLIVLTLDEDVLGKANLFNLAHHTLRFTPDGSRYRVETVATKWDSEFGAAMSGSEGTLKNFEFPFSGKAWNTLSVGLTGSITFGPRVGPAARPPSSRRC